jgi:hypothetical protein
MTDQRPPLGPNGSHPEEALAAFTDGSATPDERAAVLQHLQGCNQCRREVELSRGAVTALASLPEPPAPGLDPEAIIERAGNVAGIDPGRRPEGTRRRTGPIAGGLVAAAVVALAVAGLVRLNGGNQAASSGSAASSPSRTQPVAPEAGPSSSLDTTFGALTKDFTPESVDRLAAAEAAAEAGAHAPSTGEKRVPNSLAATASSCAAQVAGSGHVVRILVTSFRGQPAFITVVREENGTQPEIHVVVTDRTNCALLYTTNHPVGG